jgi:site-specific recombinase XerD
MSLGKAIKKFINYCAVERQLSQNTLQAYSCDLLDFGKWLPKQEAIAPITTDTLRTYLEDMVRRKLSGSTSATTTRLRARIFSLHGGE